MNTRRGGMKDVGNAAKMVSGRCANTDRSAPSVAAKHPEGAMTTVSSSDSPSASTPAAPLQWSVERRGAVAACDDCGWYTADDRHGRRSIAVAAKRHASDCDHSTFIERTTITRYSTYAGRVNA